MFLRAQTQISAPTAAEVFDFHTHFRILIISMIILSANILWEVRKCSWEVRQCFWEVKQCSQELKHEFWH